MGLVVQSFDAQVQIYRSSYSECFKNERFQLATHFAELTHATLPPRARITDFHTFKLEPRDFNYTDKINGKAFDYCNQWMPMIETAIAMYRDELLSSDR
jgi:hypothetical protein